MGSGIRLEGAKAVAIHDVELTGNGRFGLLAVSSQGSLAGSLVEGNGGGAASAGICVTSGSDFSIGKDTVETAGDLAVGGCVVGGNQAAGIYAEDSRIDVFGTLVEDNGLAGIFLADCSATGPPSLLSGNGVSAPEGTGLLLLSTGAEITGNVVGGSTECADECVSDCIYVDNPLSAEVHLAFEDNEISECGRCGLLMNGLCRSGRGTGRRCPDRWQ